MCQALRQINIYIYIYIYNHYLLICKPYYLFKDGLYILTYILYISNIFYGFDAQMCFICKLEMPQRLRNVAEATECQI